MLDGPARIASQGGPNLDPPPNSRTFLPHTATARGLNGRTQVVSGPDAVGGLQGDLRRVERGLNAIRQPERDYGPEPLGLSSSGAGPLGER